MGRYRRVLEQCVEFRKLAKNNDDYLSWANEEIEGLKQKFPKISLKPFAEFKAFLDAAIPKLVHKYLIGSGSLRQCSGISPDFAEIATSRGFPVVTQKVPGHMRNIVLCSDGPYMVDLTYIQFACGQEIGKIRDDYDTKEPEILHSYLKQVYQDPFKAVKIEKLPVEPLSYDRQPHGNYDNLYSPISDFEGYDIETTEQLPWNQERFKGYKDTKSAIQLSDMYWKRCLATETITAYRSAYNLELDPPAMNGSLGPGYYFTTNLEKARNYAGPGGYVVKVEINLHNPLIGLKTIIAKRLGLENHWDEFDTQAYDTRIGEQLSKLAKQQGYDGIVAIGRDGISREVVVFDPSSIRPIELIKERPIKSLAGKEPRHLGYMVDGDWAIVEEPDGSFSATHLNGKRLEHTNLKWLKENVMRASGFRRDNKGIWRIEAALTTYLKLVYASIADDLKKKHPHLAEKIDYLVRRDPTRKYLGYEVKVLASGQALENEIADIIDLFHKFKEKLEKKDINQWGFTELRDKLFELRDFGGDKSKTQQKKELKEEIKKVETQGAEKLYEDGQCELVYVANKAQACFYGKGTKWCITMENEHYFENYQSENVVFYYVLRKDLEADNPIQKVAISVQRDKDNQIISMLGGDHEFGSGAPIQYWSQDDDSISRYDAFKGITTNLVNIIRQDAPTRPMGFLAKLTFKPEELTAEDYAKNLDKHNKSIVAAKSKDPRVLEFLAKDPDRQVQLELSANPHTPSKILDVLVADALKKDSTNANSIITNVAQNPSTSPEALALIFVEEDYPFTLSLIAANPNTPTDIVRQLSRHREWSVRAGAAKNPNTEPSILMQLANDSIPEVQVQVAKNPEAPFQALEELAQTYIGGIRNAVFNNPNLPDHLRKRYWPNMPPRDPRAPPAKFVY